MKTSPSRVLTVPWSTTQQSERIPQRVISPSAWQHIPGTSIMFDLGLAEMVVIGGASILLLGKHDMPLVFRLVGRGVGSISGLIQGGRARMSELSEGSELLQLQNEIRSNLDDLRVIKAELRGAARLPAGITGTSHPGSTALREKSSVSAEADGASGLPQSSPSVHNHHQHFGVPVVGQGIATATAMGTVASKADRVGFGIGETAAGRSHIDRLSTHASPVSGSQTHGAGSAVAAGSALAGGGISDGSGLGQAASVERKRVGARGGFPKEAEAEAGAGIGGGADVRATTMKSVASPGSDRLQRLAMAEIEFAEKELYAPKTEFVPGGADILNETIIDTLLQERYRKVLEGPRTPDVPEPADKGEQPSSG